MDTWQGPAELTWPFNNSLSAGPFPIDVAVRADGDAWSCEGRFARPLSADEADFFDLLMQHPFFVLDFGAGGALPVEVAVGPDGRLSFAEWD